MRKPDPRLWLYTLCRKRFLDMGTNSKELGKLLGVSRATVDRWLKYPNGARIEDIRDVLQLLDFNKEEAAQIIAQIISNGWREAV